MTTQNHPRTSFKKDFHEKAFEDWFHNQTTSATLTYDRNLSTSDKLKRMAEEAWLASKSQTAREQTSREKFEQELFSELDKHDTGYGDIVIPQEDYLALKSRFVGEKG